MAGTFKKVEADVKKDFDKVFHAGEDAGKTAEKDAVADFDVAEKDVEAEAPVVEKDVEGAAKVAATDAAAEVPDVLAHPSDAGKDAGVVAKEVEEQEKGDVDEVEGVAKSDGQDLAKNAEEQAKEVREVFEKDFKESNQQRLDDEENKPTGNSTESSDAWANRFPAPVLPGHGTGPAGNTHKV